VWVSESIFFAQLTIWVHGFHPVSVEIINRIADFGGFIDPWG
jgi:hypothetical protein